MILVDVYVPALNRQYDFKMDERVFIADLLEELGYMMLPPQEQSKEKIEELLLCDGESKRVLPLHCTLKQCGIGNGSKLLLL